MSKTRGWQSVSNVEKYGIASRGKGESKTDEGAGIMNHGGSLGHYSSCEDHGYPWNTFDRHRRRSVGSGSHCLRPAGPGGDHLTAERGAVQVPTGRACFGAGA
jgi:hypothetical protein